MTPSCRNTRARTLTLVVAGWAAAGVVGVGLAGCGGGKDGDKTAGTTAATPGKTAPAPEGVSVRVTEVLARKIARGIELSGALAAPDDSVIAAEVEGKILGLRFDLGDKVRAGDVLARINPDEFRFRFEQAEAQKSQSEANLRRIEALAKAEAVAPQQLDEVRATAAQARANHDLARKKLGDTEVRAPFSGAVAKRLVSPGEYVRVGQALFQIVALDPLKMTGEVPERYLTELHVGDQVSAEIAAFAGKTWQGKVSRISPSVNPQSRSVAIEARIANRDGVLKPGMFAKLVVKFSGQTDVAVVPENALSAFAGVTKVYVIEGDTASERKVEVEQHLPDGSVAVRGSIKPGDKVASAGVGRLADGVKVSVRDSAPETAPAATPEAAARGAAGTTAR